MRGYRHHRGGSIGGAVLIIVIGLMFLVPAMVPDLSTDQVFRLGWPVIPIAIGIIGLISNIMKAPFRGRLDIGGPIILITVGVLFALQNFANIRFSHTWPVILVIIGLSLVLKRLVAIPFLPFVRRRP